MSCEERSSWGREECADVAPPLLTATGKVPLQRRATLFRILDRLLKKFKVSVGCTGWHTEDAR